MKQTLIVAAALIISFASALGWFYVNSKPKSPQESKAQDFLVVKGSSASAIGNKLEKEGLIKSSLAFKIYVQVAGKQKSILAGEYRLSPNNSLFKVVAQLEKGPVEVWVTIPEGLRREEIAERFINSLGKKPEEAAFFRQEFISGTKSKEGFLFPETYLFSKDASASAVYAKLTSTFDKKVDSKMKEDIKNLDYNLNQLITLASIIERETKTSEERSVVAGILLKRLANRWPLQVDASLQYAVASTKCKQSTECKWWETLTKDDLEIASAFNTYKYSGLPPTPIANAGLSSIKAAIYPEESPYWFYLHDAEGKIHYAKTIEEHNENIRIYLNK